jgi:choice-of-anchor B domain-containing protein
MRLTFALLFLANFLSAQVEMELFSTWSDSNLVASNAHDNTYNEIWGHSLNGREYAIIGSTEGTHFIDITDPRTPIEVDRIIGGTAGASIIHRDYHNLDNYLYGVADEGGRSTLQIMDMSFLPDSVSLVYDSRELIRRSHNIFIDTTNARLYSLISGNSTSGFTPMAIFDISDPVNPIELGRYSSIGGFSISQVHDAYIVDHLAFLNCGPSGFAIANLEDPNDPVLLSAFRVEDYPQGGYNHSGWANEALSHYYLADENHGFDMKVVDVSNPNEARFVGTFNAESESPFSIPHNQVVFEDYLYVSYYFDGVQVYDISNPAEPVRTHYYPTSTFPHTNGLYRGAWGVYPFLPSGNLIASDMQNGLFVLSGVKQTSSVDKWATSTLEIFPNPSSGRIFLGELGRAGQGYSLSSFNGNLVHKGVLSSTKEVLFPEHVPNGTYILSLNTL